MEIEIEEIDACNRKIKFDIPHGDYQKKVTDYYKSLAREVKVPGFRKGKVPQSLLEKQFGPRVKREVLTQLIGDKVTEAIREKGLKAVSQPNLLEVHAEEGTDITVSASVEVLPDFEIGDYSGIEVAMKIPRITDEEVDQMIESYRMQKAETKPVTGRTSQKDDLLKIDFVGTLDGKPFEGGEAKDYVVQLGQKQLIEDLEDKLYGMEIGEEKQTPVKIPENYFNKAIAGKEVDFTISLKGIQVRTLPELTDAFAQSVEANNKFASVADMKAKIREDLENHEKKQARKNAQKELAEKLREINPVNLPEGLVQEQIRFMAKESKKKAQQAGQAQQHDHDHDHDHAGEVSPEEQEKYREPALKILQQELLVDKLAVSLNVEVTPEELDAEVNNFIKMLGGGDPQKMKAEWQKSGVLSKLHNRMRREKTLDAVLDQVQVKEEMVDRKELIADN